MSLTGSKKRRPNGIQLRFLGMDPTFPSTTSYRFLRKRSPYRHIAIFLVFVGLFAVIWVLVRPNRYDLPDLPAIYKPILAAQPTPPPIPHRPDPGAPEPTAPVRPIEEERPKDIDLRWWLTSETPATWFLEPIPSLLSAPGPSTHKCEASPSFGPLLLIAVFSTAQSWEKRSLLRVLGRSGLADDVLRDVQFRFVVGKSDDAAAEERLEKEMAVHGDIVRLDFPENMDEGKTYEFLKWVGRRPVGERPQFALKTDDDTFLVLPNLLASIASLNCSEPIYYGTSFGSCIENCYPFYMRGMAYGMSWPLIRWLTVADMAFEDYRSTEDARTGSWFLSLPPGETLKVVDLGPRLGDYDGIAIPVNSGTVALHAMKTNWLWAETGVRLMNAWKAEGKEYMFTRRPNPPPPEPREEEEYSDP